MTEPTATTRSLSAYRQITKNAESSENMPQTQKERMDAKIQTTGPCRTTDEPQAGQMNFTQNSIEALHRRVLSGHMVIPEAVA